MEEDENCRINFIPCLKFVRRGVAKSCPEKVKLTTEELAAVINQARSSLRDNAEEEASSDEDGQENEQSSMTEEHERSGQDIEKEYDMENYDNDEEGEDLTLGMGDLVVHADPKDDPYLAQSEQDDDESDVENFEIKPTDNMILTGHVEGDAAILEVYIYNDIENDLYVHHDILLPSPPMALECLTYEPGETTKGNLVAVGYMTPVIDVWDLDIVDCLEPAYSLGCKGSKKKNIARIGHSDAVLSLAWNHHVEHVLASGSVDQSVLLWDLSEGTIASKISAHMEKVQSLQWHPFEAQSLATGCCDQYVRVFDCRAKDTCKSWKVEGEVEKVLWNHFNPFTLFVATDTGLIQLIDVRKDDTTAWTLKAHSAGVNGLTLSTQCPDCIVSVSSDKTLKVWDVSNNKPECIVERNMKLGELHCSDSCPDAPFVVAMGGDKSSDNFKVFDIRNATDVRKHFGSRELKNPLGTSDWGFKTANDAEPVDDVKMEEVNIEMQALSTESKNTGSGGAIGKFKKGKKKVKS